MEEMKDFILWFIQTVPDVLLKPPFSAFVALVLLMYIVKCLWQMMHIKF